MDLLKGLRSYGGLKLAVHFPKVSEPPSTPKFQSPLAAKLYVGSLDANVFWGARIVRKYSEAGTSRAARGRKCLKDLVLCARLCYQRLGE